jgi:hypothetical protein
VPLILDGQGCGEGLEVSWLGQLWNQALRIDVHPLLTHLSWVGGQKDSRDSDSVKPPRCKVTNRALVWLANNVGCAARTLSVRKPRQEFCCWPDQVVGSYIRCLPEVFPAPSIRLTLGHRYRSRQRSNTSLMNLEYMGTCRDQAGKAYKAAGDSDVEMPYLDLACR